MSTQSMISPPSSLIRHEKEKKNQNQSVTQANPYGWMTHIKSTKIVTNATYQLALDGNYFHKGKVKIAFEKIPIKCKSKWVYNQEQHLNGFDRRFVKTLKFSF